MAGFEHERGTGAHYFVSDDGMHCIHCGGYPFDLRHWCI